MARTRDIVRRPDPATGEPKDYDRNTGYFLDVEIEDVRFRRCDASNIEAEHQRREAAVAPAIGALTLSALPDTAALVLPVPDPVRVARRADLLAALAADERVLPGLRDAVQRAGEVERNHVASALAEGRQAQAADLVGARLSSEADLRQCEARVSVTKMAVAQLTAALDAEYQAAKDALRAECDALKNAVVQQAGQLIDRLAALQDLGKRVWQVRHVTLSVFEQQTSFAPSSFCVPNDWIIDFAKQVTRADGYRPVGS